MRRTGHYGAALLVYAPVGGPLLAVAPELAVLGGAVALALSTLPDVDLAVPFLRHRGPTHTVLFLVVVSGLLAAAAWVAGGWPGLADRRTLAAFAFLVGAIGVGSHLLADALTPMGVEPFWPLSRRNYTVALTRASNPLANWLLFVLGVLVTVAVLTTARLV